jgi:hypothetical protein
MSLEIIRSAKDYQRIAPAARARYLQSVLNGQFSGVMWAAFGQRKRFRSRSRPRQKVAVIGVRPSEVLQQRHTAHLAEFGMVAECSLQAVIGNAAAQ